jgi:hypothetical protein
VLLPEKERAFKQGITKWSDKGREMMSGELLYGVNIWLIALVIMILFLLMTEAGFRAGCKVRSGLEETAKSQVSVISGALLGLLALLLGFTFSMAQGRFALRQALVVEEANDIGTTYLRSRQLPEPYQTEVASLLRQYVDARVDFFRDAVDEEHLKEAQNRAIQLQNQLWSKALGAVAKDDRVVITGLFIQSLNNLIDTQEKRLAAMENHVPESVLLLLFIVALVATLAVGYGCGLGAHRSFFSTTMMSLLIMLVITVIIDLDRPRRGLIRVSQNSMIRLQTGLSTNTP